MRKLSAGRISPLPRELELIWPLVFGVMELPVDNGCAFFAGIIILAASWTICGSKQLSINTFFLLTPTVFFRCSDKCKTLNSRANSRSIPWFPLNQPSNVPDLIFLLFSSLPPMRVSTAVSTFWNEHIRWIERGLISENRWKVCRIKELQFQCFSIL